MSFLPNIVFAILLCIGGGFFIYNIRKLIRNIRLGRPEVVTDHKRERLKNMLRIAFGQQKMLVRPIVAVLHLIVYAGFLIINIELLEIIIDGLIGSHRIFASLGSWYYYLITAFEGLAFLVIIAVITFWIRRNIIKVPRFRKSELQGWAKKDANNILYAEMVMMSLFLLMNAADTQLQALHVPHYVSTGAFGISQYIVPLFQHASVPTLIAIERSCWWLHIIGVLCFLNYLYYSKHLHILLAFPNTYYASIRPLGALKVNPTVTREVKLMLDPTADPFAAQETTPPEKFGASDVADLTWVQLMSAYTCTECGRCTDECPANLTGKKLSPRAIMMKTRDRLEEVGKNIDKHGKFEDDGKQLLGDYITAEELWACTTCNACAEACPVSISPVSIIMELRQYSVMEQSAAPTELNAMMTNIENNGAPWAYSQADRAQIVNI